MSSSSFSAKSTATEVLANVNIANKTFLVTGGTNGIGTETVRVLANKGATVYFTARDAKKGENTVEELTKQTGNSKIHVIAMDLESFDSVRKAAKEFLAKNIPLHGLILNAGIMAVPYKIIEGHESQFTVDHLSHFLLTLLLVPALKAAYTATNVPSRVTVVSSSGHGMHDINWSDITWSKKYDKWQAYGQAKSANILFAKEFTRRYGKQGIIANAIHPGVILTGLQWSVPDEDWKAFGAKGADNEYTAEFKAGLKTIEQGAATTIWAATAKETADGGHYCEDCHISGPSESAEPGFGTGYKPHVNNPESMTKLWDLSVKATGAGAN